MPIVNLVKDSAATNPIQVRTTGLTAEIDIFGPIGDSLFGDTVSLKSFRESIKSISDNTKEIIININSPGGDVFDGIAIYNLLKSKKWKKKVKVHALAASIASVIALAGDEVEMGTGAMLMVHLPWTGSYGNRKDFESVIENLVRVEEQLVTIYAKQTGLSRTEIRNLMEKETWMTADEAIELKFATSKVEDALPIAASALDKATWIARMPKNIWTSKEENKKKLEELRNKIEIFRSARK
jgi:ATP-dependent Clp protease protease subunit